MRMVSGLTDMGPTGCLTRTKDLSCVRAETRGNRSMQGELRERLSKRLAAPPPYPHERFSGRGVVTCAGGTRYFTCVWVLIWVLRRVHRCSLPIQVWHLGRAEMSEGMRLVLEAEGVEVVDAQTVVSRHPARVSGG